MSIFYLPLRNSTLLLSLAVYLTVSCRPSQYEKLEQEQLSRNVRYDSLFLGMYLGMQKKDFYTSCWELNKRKLIMQGPGNLSVQYMLDSLQMKHTAYMMFYPNFYEDKISDMPVEFSYEAWAPWNTETTAEKLLIDVKDLLERWYGTGFISLENEDKTVRIWVKVDGNRRIRLYIKNIATVKAEFVDLTVKNLDRLKHDSDD